MALISSHNTAFAYEGKTVISDISFNVNQGDYLCIVGENGSGKTTLMKGILKLLKPSQGEIVFGDGFAPNKIGYMPQQNSAQKNFPASVYEVVLSGRLNSRGILPMYSKKDKQCALDNMERLGIANIAKKSFRDLSGGQQQRALLGRALCATKTALLLDEPAAGLDPLVTADMYSTIQTLSADMGITIIMISHDIGAAVEYASHILHIHNRQGQFTTVADYCNTAMGQLFVNALNKGANDGIV